MITSLHELWYQNIIARASTYKHSRELSIGKEMWKSGKKMITGNLTWWWVVYTVNNKFHHSSFNFLLNYFSLHPIFSGRLPDRWNLMLCSSIFSSVTVSPQIEHLNSTVFRLALGDSLFLYRLVLGDSLFLFWIDRDDWIYWDDRLFMLWFEF